jgi:hypothetical protein
MLPKDMNRLPLWLAAVAAMLVLVPTQSVAQTIACGKHDAIVAALKSHYQENRQAIGLAATAGVVELYVSDAGSWTMIVTTPAGQTCIAAAGQAWQSTPQQTAKTDT